MTKIESRLPLVKELEVSAVVKQKRKEKKTVAIVGFAPTSRHAAPYDDPDVEVWSLNEAYHYDFMKRWDRWFQIHQRWSFTRKGNRNHEEHFDWLKEEHDFPIYMLKKYSDIPASVEYPFEELRELLLGHVRRGDPYEDGERNDYFTSSFAWMAALMAYEKKAGIEDWGRLEIYGFEMATDTEYRHQKGSTEFWIGYLAGMGIEIRVTKHCLLLKGGIYGQDIHALLTKDIFETRLKQLKNRQNEAMSKMNIFHERRVDLEKEVKNLEQRLYAKRVRSEVKESIQQQIEVLLREHEQSKNDNLYALSLANSYAGAIQETESLINYITSQDPELGAEYSEELQSSFVHRQELDFREGQLRRGQENLMSQLNAVSGQRQFIDQRGAQLSRSVNNAKYKKSDRRAWKQELEWLTKSRMEFINTEQQVLAQSNANHGAIQIVREYLSVIDTTLDIPDPKDEMGRELSIIGRIQIGEDTPDGEAKEAEKAQDD